METYQGAKSVIIGKKQRKEMLSHQDSFALANLCSRLLRHDPKDGRDLLIRALDIWTLIPQNNKVIWNDLAEASGLYPYVKPELLSRSALIRYEYHCSNVLPGYVLHEEQMDISQELGNSKSVVITAPTSFGKSLLIEELIARNKYKNIVIIQPTLALIDETRKKLRKYDEHYKLILSTTQEPSSEGRNIFLFTGERVVEYKSFPKIDFFVIDEFYKLSLERDDDRAIALNQAFSKLLTFTNKFYMLGPMVRTIPAKFMERFDLVWFPTTFATVAVDELNIELKSLKKQERNQEKINLLYELLINTNEQTIIYCSSPQKATELAIGYLNHLKEVESKGRYQLKANTNDISEWISENINKEWSLIEAINCGIAFHHGALPRHLGCSIVEEFNKQKIKYLFCTSTLIEGVNTTAKNVILFDQEKGKKSIDYFDYKNIAGRSGRMKQHFVGNVFRFEKEPQQMELDVDIPIFNQANAPIEILIGLHESQIDESAKSKLSQFEKYPSDLQELLRMNLGISVEGQLAIIEKIESNLSYYHKLLSWTKTPTKFDDMSAVVELCWEYLIGPGDKTYIPKIGRLSARWLASFSYSYVKNKSIRAVIGQYVKDSFWINKIPSTRERNDIVTYSILHIARHWFDYKLPKWIKVISNIQEYVFKKHNMSFGNYAYTASSIENGFIHPNISAIIEYDIPITAIHKLSEFINQNLKPEENVRNIRNLSIKSLHSHGLLAYEIKKIQGS